MVFLGWWLGRLLPCMDGVWWSSPAADSRTLAVEWEWLEGRVCVSCVPMRGESDRSKVKGFGFFQKAQGVKVSAQRLAGVGYSVLGGSTERTCVWTRVGCEPVDGVVAALETPHNTTAVSNNLWLFASTFSEVAETALATGGRIPAASSDFVRSIVSATEAESSRRKRTTTGSPIPGSFISWQAKLTSSWPV